MDPVALLTALVEASIGLLGFSGVVLTLGRTTGPDWSRSDRFRLICLLSMGAITLGSTLFPLVLVSAELDSRVVWRAASLAWLATIVPSFLWGNIRVFRARPLPIATHFIVIATNVVVGSAIALQILNLALWSDFWPHFSALAISLGLGVLMFIRLLWFKIFG